MTSVTDTIKSAYRRSGVLAAGVNVDSTNMGVGLEQLQGMYQGFVGTRLFGELELVTLTSANAYTAVPWTRVLNTAGAAVTYPVTVQNPDDGETQAPDDGAIVVVSNSTSHSPDVRIYDAYLANWQQIANLGLNDYAPMTFRFDDHIKNLLAVKIADDVGNPVSKLLVYQAGLAKNALAMLRKRVTRLEYY